ncbi:unnamed protein product, partial [Ceratitis capitata]
HILDKGQSKEIQKLPFHPENNSGLVQVLYWPYPVLCTSYIPKKTPFLSGILDALVGYQSKSLNSYDTNSEEDIQAKLTFSLCSRMSFSAALSFITARDAQEISCPVYWLSF